MTRDNNAASGCVFGLIACLPVWVLIIACLWRLLK